MKQFEHHIRVISILLLVIIPVLYLYNYFSELAEKNASVNEELVKEKLLNEMDSFQDILKPENHIERAFLDLEEKFSFPDFDNSQYKYMFGADAEPPYFKNSFIGKAKYFLKENYGFEPFIFISSAYDFTEISFDDKDSFFDNEKAKRKFLYSCLGGVISSVLDGELFRLKPVSEKSKKSFEQGLNDIFQECEMKYYPKFQLVFEVQIMKYFSVFFKELGKVSTSYAFFTNKFGNQRIYQYFNALINKVNKKDRNFLGLYYALVRSSDILIEKMLYKAVNNLYTNKYSEIKRGISNNITKVPNLYETDKSIIYEVPFPSHFYNFIAEHKDVNYEMYKTNHDYLINHSLVVSIDRDKIENDYVIYKQSLEIVLWIFIIIIFVYIVISFTNFVKFKFSLSSKIKMIVLVAVAIPITGLWIISYQGMKNEERIILSKTEKAISDRMALLSKIKDDVISSFVIDLMERKKIFADAYFDSTPDNYFIKSSSNKELQKELSNPYFTYSYLLDKYGKTINYKNINVSREISSFKDIYKLYKILLDMNLLDRNTKENKKYYEQYLLYSTYTDSYFKKSNAKNVLAKESLLIPSEGLTLKDKVTYQLLSPKANPNNPSVLLHSFIDIRDILDKRFNELINENYFDLLSQETGTALIKYAIFARRDSIYREKIPQQRVYPFRLFHLDAAKKAIVKKNSGTEIKEKGNYYYISTWRYFSDCPIIFTAAAIVPKSHINLITGNIVALILLIYAILVVTLLSDFFIGALLEPIKTLYRFVNEISLGHFNVKINMNTGDEMEELGDSFNKMSDGLCEREKLKRFVSDKLYSSLEKSEEKRISRAKVTILSSDIRSFTTISEKNEPEAVVGLLNDYFTLMEKSIVKYGGSIEKIVGDAISAAFYEEKNPNYPLQACKAALEMRENLKKFNQERREKGLFTIENGIGLATGEVMIGFAGEKARRREFLLIGNILKSAENLEAMTKQAVSSKVFIDRQTYDLVHDKIKLCSENSDSEVFYRELQL